MFLEKCTEDQLKKIYESCDTNEANLQRDLKILEEWADQQPHLPKFKDDDLLRMVLMRNKLSIERSKESIEKFFIFKTRYPKLFMNPDPTTPEFRKCFETAPFIVMPKLTPELNRVTICRFNVTAAQDLSTPDEYAANILTLMAIIGRMCGIFNKAVAIIDYKDLSVSMIPVFLSCFTKIGGLINSFAPTRIEAIYVLNSSPLIEPVLAIGRKISKKLFQDRLIIWKKSEKDLVEVIAAECLPNEYGGTAGSFKQIEDGLYKEIESYKGWIQDWSRLLADLSKIPEERKTILDMGEYGVDGSFKKLDLE